MTIEAKNKIFIKPDAKETKYGSIYLPETEEQTDTGTVVYGFGEYVEGTKVIYDKALTIKYKELVVIEPDDIWGIIHE